MLANQDVLNIATAERRLTLDIAIKGKNMQSILKTHGDELPLKALSGIILLTTEFFSGSGTQMTAAQSFQTASLLLDSYPAETIEDVLLCFKNAKQGRYGKIYNRIDGQIIFEWFKQYLDEKYSYIEMKHHNEKHEKNDQNNVTLDLLSSFIEPIIAYAKQSSEQQPAAVSKIDEKQEIEALTNHINKIPTQQLKTLLNDYETKSKRNFWSHYDSQRNLITKEIERRERITTSSGTGKGDDGQVHENSKPDLRVPAGDKANDGRKP